MRWIDPKEQLPTLRADVLIDCEYGVTMGCLLTKDGTKWAAVYNMLDHKVMAVATKVNYWSNLPKPKRK